MSKVLVNPLPKPAKSKKKRAKNNPKPTQHDTCYICGKPYAQTHEVFYGRGKRQLSIKYGMQCKLCEEHHTGPNGIHNDPYFDFKVKQIYQRRFEEQYRHELFIKLFGRNYLGMTYEEYKKKVIA